MKRTSITCGLVLASVLCAAPSRAQTATRATAAPVQAAQDPDIVRAQKPSYPLKTCAVSGEALGSMGEPVDYTVKGRLVRLCCKGCTKELDKDPSAAFEKIDEAVVAAQKPSYPLTTCAATGAKLDDKAIDHVHGTRLVRLANREAIAQFEKDPKAAMAKVDKALIEAQRPNYKLKTCVVSEEPLGGEMGEPVDYLYGTKLVRFCCKSCVRMFEKSPEQYVKALQ
jgi:hypothetical protein